MWPFSKASPKLTLGTVKDSFPLWPTLLTLDPALIATHKHVIGTTGTGKTGLLKSIVWQLITQGIGVSFIDPHGDAVQELLAMLIHHGFFKRPGAFDKLWYVEFTDDEDGHFLPMNWLNQPHVRPHTLASNVVEAFHRVWPSLAEGVAPAFDSSVKYGTKILISSGLTLPALLDVLTAREYREAVLATEQDPDVGKFFAWLDNLSRQEQSTQIASTLRRVELLSFSPALKYTLGQQDNRLDFREIIDSGRCVLYNLQPVRDHDARRLLGALLAIGYEEAALSRPLTVRTQHHLVLDEMAEFVSKSEESLVRMLSETRKYGLFVTMAHQTWGQLGRHLQGALQNVGVEMCLRIGREDGELMAKWLGAVDPSSIKLEPTTPNGHPVFYSVQEQWEGWVSALTELPNRGVLVKLAGKPAVQIKTLDLQRIKMDQSQLERIKGEYRRRLMRRRSEITLPHQRGAVRQPQRVSRWVPLEKGDGP